EPRHRRRRGGHGRQGRRPVPYGGEMEPDPAGGDGGDRVPAEHQRPLVDGGRQLKLIEELRRICGDEHVVTEHHALRTYESDGLLQYATVPRAAVLPGTGDEGAAVVRAC